MKNDGKYFIEYQNEFSSPDYDTFNKYPYQIYDFPENPTVDEKDEYNNDIQVYYGKTLKIEFNLCNENCKSCKSIGKLKNLTKCEECKDNYKYYIDENTNTKTCFPKEIDCPAEFPFINLGRDLKCEDKCILGDIKNDICFLDNTSVKAIQSAYNLLENFISNHYDDEDIIIKSDDDLIFHLSNSLNEKIKLNGGKGNYYNLSIIDLGDCEQQIKKVNNISDDASLILFKLETYYENTTKKKFNMKYMILLVKTKFKIYRFVIK